MKKTLLSAALLVAALSVNAQNEIGYIDPSVVGVTSDGGVVLAAGTELAKTDHITASIKFEDTFKATGLKGDNMTFNGEALATDGMGMQGNTNGPGTAASTGEFPTQGCIFKFHTTANGYLYVFHAGSGNKNYVVFEETDRIPYVYAMENTSGDDAGTAPATFAYDLKTMDGACWYDASYDEYFVNEGYSIPQAAEAATGTQYKTTGNSVIKFQVWAGLDYCVLATGSKMTLAAFAYDKTGDATVTTDANVLLDKGGVPGGETGIANVTVSGTDDANAPAYNIAGQRVNRNAKGLVIVNGKKFINK